MDKEIKRYYKEKTIYDDEEDKRIIQKDRYVIQIKNEVYDLPVYLTVSLCEDLYYFYITHNGNITIRCIKNKYNAPDVFLKRLKQKMKDNVNGRWGAFKEAYKILYPYIEKNLYELTTKRRIIFLGV